MPKKRADAKHKRPTAEELDERVSIPLDPQTVIEGMMQVDGPDRSRQPDC